MDGLDLYKCPNCICFFCENFEQCEYVDCAKDESCGMPMSSCAKEHDENRDEDWERLL